MQTDELRPEAHMAHRAQIPQGQRHAVVSDLLVRLSETAALVRRMPPPSRLNPEAFHIARDALGHELQLITDGLREALR